MLLVMTLVAHAYAEEQALAAAEQEGRTRPN